MRVLMIPDSTMTTGEESGIRRVIETYENMGSEYGIEYVRCKVEDESLYDVFAVHAGSTNRYPKHKPIVAHLHGLYWTADYNASRWEWRSNANVIAASRLATVITVPSMWVSETIRRDLRVTPKILPHGIIADNWKHGKKNGGYVLWNKNRKMDVCNPKPVGVLAEKFPKIIFETTFNPDGYNLGNIHTIGLQEHVKMRDTIQRASVYLSTTKETFGIGILEAMASGVPVLGFNHGGITDIVKHGVNGYLAVVNDYSDLATGLEYCIENRKVLSENSVVMAKEWGWDSVMKKLYSVYDRALNIYEDSRREMYVDESSYVRAV